jgi:uridine kinase
VVLLSQDSFYRGLTPQESANAANYNFDDPKAFDWDLLVTTIEQLKQGKSVEVPIYDFSTHSRYASSFSILKNSEDLQSRKQYTVEM